jgi:hypothetical protein
MGGLSLSKLVLLAVIVAIVWYGLKYLERVETIRRALREELRRRQGAAPRQPPIKAEDLIKCATCGTYVAARGAAPCGRADCPWRR